MTGSPPMFQELPVPPHALSSTPNWTERLCAVIEGVNEPEEREARRAGVVVKSKWFSWIPMNEWGGELFDPSTTPALRATPPVPGGELFLPLLQFIHTLQTAPSTKPEPPWKKQCTNNAD